MKRVFLTMLYVLIGTYIFSQKGQVGNVSHDVIYPSEFHITEPLRDIVAKHPYVQQEREHEESFDKNYRTPQTFLYTAEDGPEYGEDPSIRQTVMGTRPIPSNKAIIKNWAGQVATGFRPMDPTGAAGPNHYIQAINGTPFKVFNKSTGANMLTANIGSLWSPATPNDGDPIIMYDKYADRWFVSQFGQTGNSIYIAISQTNDPTGAYYTYTYNSPQFPDYLKFSIWENGYYMTSNQSTDKVFCFERDQMLIGNPTARSISANFTTGSVGGFFVPLPADAADGGLPPAGTPLPFFAYYDNAWGGGNDGIKIWNMTVTWGATASATISPAIQVNTSAFDGSYDPNWLDITQPGTTQKLDGIGGVLMYRAQWRPWTGYNSVVISWPVKINASQRSMRWAELRQNQGTGVWSLYQESTYAPDADSRWMGSIAMDNNGSIALAYCKSSGTTYPTLCYTGRLASDPLGTMTFTETIAINGTSSQTGTGSNMRFGDYAQTSLDPDGITFWHTGEYISSGVKTRVYSFQLPAGPMAPIADFAANTTTPCIGSTVSFTDFSSGVPTSWAWTFNPTSVTYVGGTNASSQNPQVVFNAAGPYTVTLVATNANGTDNQIKTNYITPVSPGALPVVENFEGATFPPTGWSIENGDGTTTWGTAGAKGLERRAAAGNTGSTSGCAGIELFNYNTDTSQVDNLISMPLSLSGVSAPKMTFKRAYKYYNSATNPNNYHDELRVYVSTDCGSTYGTALYYKKGVNLATNGTLNTSFSPSVAADWDTDTIDLSAYINQSIVIKFEVTNRYGNNLYLDDINIDAAPAAAPVADFTANPVTTICSGDVQFTDASTNSPTSWLWNFGDGQTSTAQNPLHSYTSNGTYTVTLTATNPNGNDQMVKSNYITINIPVAPTATGGSRCGTGTVNLSASGAGTLHWFDAATGGTDLGTGTTFTTPVISATTTFYVEDHLVQPSQYVGPTVAGATNNNASYLIFDCYTPVTLVSVAVNAGAAGNRTIELQNSAGTTLLSTTVNIPAGASRVTLNFAVPVGTGLRLYTAANANLFRKTTGVAYPYTLTGMVSITGNSSTATRYPFFFDWEIKEPDCISTRVPVTATITPGPVAGISIAASTNNICAGQSVTFTATPTNGGTTPTYQWQVNGVNAGTNSPNFTSTTLANNDVVTCILTSSETCISSNPATSNTVTMTVSSSVTPTVAIAASSSTICSGTSVTFTATPTNGGTPSYQWQLNGSNVGTNSPTYTNGTLANGNTITCIMTSSLSCASPSTANSNTVTMTVSAPVTPSVAISASATTICSGTSVTFTATPTNGGTPSYQWKLNGVNVGTNSPTYTNGALTNGNTVTCVMTSTAACASPTTATSNSVSMTVNASVTPTVAISASSTTICTGTSVTFTATPTNGGTPTYQWTLNGSNVGTNSPTYTNGSLANSDVVACTMTSTASCANPATVNSNSVTMTVNSVVAPAVSISASSSTICSGQSVTFTATPTNGGTPSYQWTLNGSNVGTNSPTYTNASLGNGDNIACTMTSTAPCVSPITASSNTVTITVSTSVAPAVSIAASSTTICSGQSVTFTATPTNGGTPDYQWTLNGSNVGSNSPTYTNGTLSDADVVACTMTSSLGCASPSTASSNFITMSVGTSVSPSVSIAASATSICTGTSVTFTATPTNGGTPDYLWTLNGSNVGTNSPTYTSSTLNNGDVVVCSMTSSLACATPSTSSSNQVVMSVSNPVSPAIVIAASSTNICSGTIVTFNATSVNGGTPNYQWTLNGGNVGTNSSTYTNGTLSDGDVIACSMTSTAACVSPTTATSNTVSMTVTATVSPTIDITANPSGSVCPGTPIVFTANETNGGTPSYQWTVNGLNAGTSNTLTGTYTNGQVVICSMTSSLNCATPATVQSTPVIVSIYSVSGVTIFDNSGTLSSSEIAGNQWYEQSTGIIVGETGQDFMPTADGLYYTIVTDANGCTSMSNVIDFIYMSVSQTVAGTNVRIYPNPSKGLTIVDINGKESNDAELIIHDIVGKQVYNYKFQNINGNTKLNVNLSNYENGVYFFKIRIDDDSKEFQVIKE